MVEPVICGANDINDFSGKPCPSCNRPGKKIAPQTLKSLIKNHLLPDELNGYRLCMSGDCDVVYYGERVFHKDDVTVRVWFKETDPAVPVCYCKGVTEGDIIEHVALKGCCSDITDIQNHTGANTGKECLTKNPAGT